MKHIIKSKILELIYFKENKKVKEIISNPDNKPIYHYHVRKTAGTSINYAFLKVYFGNDIDSVYNQMANKRNHRVFNDNHVIVGWNKSLINSGNYSYAFSHIPFHRLSLKSSKIYTFTCLRDPEKRVISHYNMLMYYQKNNIKHPCMKVEGRWLGNSFSDFLSNVPKKHLQNQLYMFSRRFDLNEAISNINKLNRILFTEELNKGLDKISMEMGLKLEVFNKKSYGNKEQLNFNERNNLKELLKEEILFYNIVKKNN